VVPLVAAVNEAAPDVVVVSGDLTQRARASQFQAARRFLDSLPGPQVVIPGNHDVPFYNVLSRFVTPLRNYRRYIGNELNPFFCDAELAIKGLNTARSLTMKNGRISRAQVAEAAAQFRTAPDEAVKILVTHHPLDLPARFSAEHLVGGAQECFPALAEAGIDVLLSGHYHLSHTGDTATRYPLPDFAALVIQAGTTTSTRLRDEPNAFNLLRIESARIIVDRYTWRPEEGVFASFLTEAFQRRGNCWMREPTVAAKGPDIPASPSGD
jgi:3',5'-cyclic AMP phosphodiesterase CpdA